MSFTGQVKLKDSSVLIVGCGGLGCPIAQYLAVAGVGGWVGGCDDCDVITGSRAGHIGLVDYDVVELSNLHRQVIKN